MPDLASFAEIRARLTSDEFTKGSEEVRRSAEQLKGMLGSLEQSFQQAGKSANTSERALESFWGTVNSNVSRANDFARAMDRFKQFEAANPTDSRLPLILADIKTKYADLGTAAEDASRHIGGSDGALQRWQTVALRASQIAGGLSSEFSILGPISSAFASSLGGPVALGVSGLTLGLGLLVSKLREVPQYTSEAKSALEKFSSDLGASAIGRQLGIGTKPPERNLTSTGRAIAASAPSAGQTYLDAQAASEEFALKIAESRQRSLDQAAAEQEARARAIAGFSRVDTRELDAAVQQRLAVDAARSNPFPQRSPFAIATERYVRREANERRENEEALNGAIEREVTLLEEANKHLGQSVAQREAGLRILELEYRFGTQLTAQERARIQLAAQHRREAELAGVFQRQVTYDFASFLDSVQTTGKASFGQFFADVLTGFRRMVNQMIAEWAAAKVFGGGSSAGSSLASFLPSALSLFGGSPVPASVAVTPQVFGSNIGSYIGARAGGGDVSAGMPYLVGEQGPELFMPRSSGTIIPNGGYGPQVTVNIDARGADVGVVERLRGLVQREVAAGITAAAPGIAGAAYGAVATRLRNTGRGGL